MKCDKEQAILDHLFGAGSPQARAELEAHLAACPGCRARYEALGGVKKAAAGALAPDPVSRDFTAVLMRRLAADEADAPAAVPAFRRLLRPAYGLAFAALALCVLFGVRALRERPGPKSAPEQVIFVADGPAVPGNTYDAPPLLNGAGAERPSGQTYTDGCMTAKCGVM